MDSLKDKATAVRDDLVSCLRLAPTYDGSNSMHQFPAGIFCLKARLHILPAGLIAHFALTPACNFFPLAGMHFLPSGQMAIVSLRRAGKFFPQAAGRNLLHFYSMHFLHYR